MFDFLEHRDGRNGGNNHPEMSDEEFLSAAVDRLPDSACRAAAACAAAQLGGRLTPGEIMKVADALGAPRNTVLALMGWVHSRYSRRNRFAFLDMFRHRVSKEDAQCWSDETLLAVSVFRTAVRSLDIH